MKNKSLVYGGIALAAGLLIWYFKIQIIVAFTGTNRHIAAIEHNTAGHVIVFIGIFVAVWGIITIIKSIKSRKWMGYIKQYL